MERKKEKKCYVNDDDFWASTRRGSPSPIIHYAWFWYEIENVIRDWAYDLCEPLRENKKKFI